MNNRAKQLEAIFHAASGLSSPEQRANYLNEACRGDAALRNEVEAILEAAPVGEELFQPVERASTRLSNPPLEALTECPGATIGRYKLLEKIGEGGMGVVYMAEQEQPVRRKVALKIIKLGMDTRQVVARFEAERQALALMDHPNIARVLDGGATDAGRPFFVMELVQGVPITEFCDANHLSIQQLLQLFIAVCDAIQSAHQKGIIHRDLKPSNVLVTMHNGAPHPMVIDFGVAKAIDQKLTEKTLFTNFATMIGTPAYMSPEQAEMSRLDVDTRSDIYSLGVLLYELLTSTTPFPEERLRSVAYGEMQRIIAEEEPERPSTRLKKKGVARSEIRNPTCRAEAQRRRESEIDSDLDWIVMKCLEKDRDRRYETANGLAADLNRYLNDEPVIARPPSAAYRFQKLIRRNRTASVATVLITLALLSGIGVSTWALIRERAARHQADQRLRAALGFVDDVFEKVSPGFKELPGAANAQEQLGQAGLSFLKRLRATDATEDPTIGLTMGRVLVKLAEAQNVGNANSLGYYEAGIQYAEQALAVLTNNALPVSNAERTRLRAEASICRMHCFYALGRVEDAVRAMPEVDSAYRRLEQFPEHARYAVRMQHGVRNNTGYALILAGRPREGLENFLLPLLSNDWAGQVKTNLANAESYELDTYMNVNVNIATAYLFLHQATAMLPCAIESLRVADEMVKREPGSARPIRKQASCMAIAGYALVHSGEVSRGLELLSTSRASMESLIDKEPGNEPFRVQRAVTTAIQALAFSLLSEDLRMEVSERRKRLDQADGYLKEAGAFTVTTGHMEPTSYVKLARKRVEATKANSN